VASVRFYGYVLKKLSVSFDFFVHTKAYTIDRTWKEQIMHILRAYGVCKTLRDLHAVHSALSLKNRYITIEQVQRDKLKNKT
jgi:hypothetical protein